MASFVVRLDHETIFDLMSQWRAWGCQSLILARGQLAPSPGTTYPEPTLAFREDLWNSFDGVGERLRWLYYCDNADGITLRLYDEMHFSRYAPDGYYIENPSPRSREHFERVIVRGFCMGEEHGGDAGLRLCRLLHNRSALFPSELARTPEGPILQRDVTNMRSNFNLKLRMRAASPWMIWKATEAPDSFTSDTPTHNVNPAEYTIRMAYFGNIHRNADPHDTADLMG
jgi:hypothetical protein